MQLLAKRKERRHIMKRNNKTWRWMWLGNTMTTELGRPGSCWSL